MSLRSLSNDTILSRIMRLTRCERSLTLRVLLCLNEIERRKLHHELGYRSMFDFCTKALGYSEPTAGRRIQTARALARYPEIQDLLTAGHVTVCAIARVAGVLAPHNKDKVLARIRGRTLDEVAEIVAEYKPREVPRDRVKVIAVAVPAVASAAALLPNPSPSVRVSEPVASKPCAAAASCEDRPEIAGEKRFILEFSVDKEFMKKLEQIRSLSGHRLPPNASLEQVFALVMDRMIESESPVARQARREKRSMRRAPAVSTDSNPRHIPARVRDEVILRDGQRCTYVSPDGRRCDSTRLLQIDHIVPVARGGTARLDNLRVLCAYHNRLEAERLGLPGAPVRGQGAHSDAPRGNADDEDQPARVGASADRRALSH